MENFSPSLRTCPLNVNYRPVAKKSGLLTRKQKRAMALVELDNSLLKWIHTHLKYEFTLFGLGFFDKF